jgi:holo-[acyl-carrier protein] synthase
MKIFLGTDICEIDRIGEIYERHGSRFLDKVFTQNEINYCIQRKKLSSQRLAVRFATKEAAAKALGVGVNKLGWNKGIDWKDVEILRDKNGAVEIKLHGKAKKFEEKLGITNWAISVSHSKNNAVSTVIGYRCNSIPQTE